MKTIKTLILFLAFSLLTSCYMYFGMTSQYRYVHSNHPTLLKHFKNNDLVCDAKYSDSCKVLVTTGNTLKTCISETNKSLIYIWEPRCKGSLCYSLDALQRICSEKGISLYIVSESYDALMNKKYSLEHPIIGIDTKYYKTNVTTQVGQI